MAEIETIDDLIDLFAMDFESASDIFDIDDVFQIAMHGAFKEKSVKDLACYISDTRLLSFLKNYRESFEKSICVATYYKSILVVNSRFKRNYVEGYKLAIKGGDYMFSDILSIQYNLLRKTSIPAKHLIYWATILSFEYVVGYSSCVLQSEIRKIADEIGLNLSLSSEGLGFKSSENHNLKEVDSNQIKVDVNPQITINPQFVNNPTFTFNTSEISQRKTSVTDSKFDSFMENARVKRWKGNAMLTFVLSSIITALLIVISTNRWFLSEMTWQFLEKYGVIKWVTVIVGIVWNAFIFKILYDRFFDSSKEKAFRDGLRKDS